MAAHFAAAAFLVVAVGAADGAQPLRRRAQMGGWSGDADGVCEKRAEGTAQRETDEGPHFLDLDETDSDR